MSDHLFLSPSPVYSEDLENVNLGDFAMVESIFYHFNVNMIGSNLWFYDQSALNYNIFDPFSRDYIYFQSINVLGVDVVGYYEGFWGAKYIKKALSNGTRVNVLNLSYGNDARHVNIHKHKFHLHEDCYFYVRDEYSLEALLNNFKFANPPKLCSDLVFAYNHNKFRHIEDFYPNLYRWMNTSNNKPVVAINLNKGFGKNNKAVYKEVKKFMINNSHKYKYYLLPHDSRPHADERELLLNELTSNFDVDCFLGDYFIPSKNQSILSSCSFILTCKMHPAILALSVGTPAIVLEYNGFKSYGTLAHFGLEKFAINFNNIHRIQEKVSDLENNYGYYQKLIKHKLPSVISLAKTQFESFVL
jgi:polysaccharide pyruvyl transferase WcaK-like protein